MTFFSFSLQEKKCLNQNCLSFLFSHNSIKLFHEFIVVDASYSFEEIMCFILIKGVSSFLVYTYICVYRNGIPWIGIHFAVIVRRVFIHFSSFLSLPFVHFAASKWSPLILNSNRTYLCIQLPNVQISIAIYECIPIHRKWNEKKWSRKKNELKWAFGSHLACWWISLCDVQFVALMMQFFMVRYVCWSQCHRKICVFLSDQKKKRSFLDSTSNTSYA